jgi:predicted PurR-regulated permease PerM
MIRAVLVIIAVALFWYLRDLVMVVITAIVLASFVDSAVPHLLKLRMGRIGGIVVLYAISILCLLGLFYLFAPLLITELYNFSTFLSAYIPGVSFLNFFQNAAFSGAKDIVTGLAHNFSFATLNQVSQAFISNLSGGFVSAFSIAFGGIFNFVLIILLSFYLSIQQKGIENLLRIIFPIKHEEYVVDLWDRSSKKIALWMRGQMLLALVVAVLIYLLLSLLGIEYALLLALIVGMMEMVPYGILVALIPAFAFSYLSQGLGSALMVTGSYLIIHQFEVFLFAPLIIKKIVGLSPIVIILAIVVGFELGGIWGALISIPVAIIIMEFLGDIEKSKYLARSQQ